MSWSGWYLRNSSISANLRSVIGVATPFRLLVVLLLEGNAPVTFSVNHRPDSTGFYTLPGTLTNRHQPCRERSADARLAAGVKEASTNARTACGKARCPLGTTPRGSGFGRRFTGGPSEKSSRKFDGCSRTP